MAYSLPDSRLSAHVFHALLTSTRISHKIAAKTLYSRREAIRTTEKKTATELGGLAELLRQKYDGDLNNLLNKAKQGSAEDNPNMVRSAVRDGLQDIKGIGGAALDVFCDTAHGVWHELAPFLDPRS